MTNTGQLAREAELAQTAIAAAEARMLELANDPFAFEKARQELDAARREAERVKWAGRRLALEAERAQEAANRSDVEHHVAAARQAREDAGAVLGELEAQVEALAAGVRRLLDLRRVVERGFQRESWALGAGLLDRPTLGTTRLPVSPDLAARLIRLGTELAGLGGHDPKQTHIRAQQRKEP